MKHADLMRTRKVKKAKKVWGTANVIHAKKKNREQRSSFGSLLE